MMRWFRQYDFLNVTKRQGRVALALLLSIPASASAALAQTPTGQSPALIAQPINEASIVKLTGNTRREAQNPANDQGAAPADLPLEHMFLQLRRPAAQEQAVKTLIDELHDPQSPNFHQWLTAAEIGTRFGPAASDVQTVIGWLKQHEFTVNSLLANQMIIDFSGTAGLVNAAFHTEIHNLSVNGEAHFANVSDPQIPAALAPVVVGVVALHNFANPSNVAVPPQPNYSQNNNYYVTPGDLATIYNFNPLFNRGISGQGQTIYVLEPTDLYTNNGAINDWAAFRSAFGLSGYSATLTTVHPGGCTDPGLVGGEESEAILDTEYASAGAPSANIVVALMRPANHVG